MFKQPGKQTHPGHHSLLDTMSIGIWQWLWPVCKKWSDLHISGHICYSSSNNKGVELPQNEPWCVHVYTVWRLRWTVVAYIKAKQKTTRV